MTKSRISLLLCAAALPTALLAAVAPGLRGTLLESKAWSYGKPQYGLYAIPTSPGEEFRPLSAPLPHILTEGYDDGQGRYYSTYVTSNQFGFAESCFLTVYNTADWSLIDHEELPDFSLYAFASAEDPATGEVYACCSNAQYNGYDWVKIDYPSRRVEVIQKEIPIYFKAIGADADGQFYGVTEFGRFVKIDKLTGDYTEYPSDPVLPFSVGEGSQYGACVDDTNGRFVIATYDYWSQTSALHTFALTDGEYVKEFDFPKGEQVLGLYYPPAPPAPLAPGTPVLTAQAGEGSSTVTLSCQMPRTLNNGNTADGQTFSYVIKAAGATIAEGTAAPGETVNATYDAPQTGTAHFSAYVSNEEGSSRLVRTHIFVGYGMPDSPTGVSLVCEDMRGTLTWNPVTTSADGGFLNPEDITYYIYNKEGELIRDTSDCSLSIEYGMPEEEDYLQAYCYSVVAVNHDRKSKPAVSNRILIGHYDAPESLDFSSEDAFDLYTVVDANGDGISWEENFGKAMVGYSLDKPMDDWLMSPPIMLTGGATYPFKARVQAADPRYPERLEVLAGLGLTPDDMTIMVVEPTTVADDSYHGMEISGMIKAEETGIHYIGFHGISDTGMYTLSLLGFEVGEALATTTPAAITDFRAEADPEGTLTATLSFTAPAEDIDGKPLTGLLDAEISREGKEGTNIIYSGTLEPGATFSFTDELPAAGTFTYSATISSNGAAAQPAIAEVYVGPQPAQLVSEVYAYQSADDRVELSWPAVTTDMLGNKIDPADVTYDVYSVTTNAYGQLELEKLLNPEPLTECRYSAETTPSATQDYRYFAVQSKHRGAAQTDLRLGHAVFGAAYPTPHRLSCEQDTKQYFLEVWGSDNYCGIVPGSSKNGIEAQDGDDSYFMAKTPYTGESTYMSTGRVSLEGVAHPVMTFWIYGFDIEGGDPNLTAVTVVCDGKENAVAQFAHNRLTPGRWNRVSVDLSEYEGETVQLRINTLCNGTQYALYDAIYIGETVEHDLAVSLTAPARVSTGAEMLFTIDVANNGAFPAKGYLVELTRDGEVMESVDCQEELAVSDSRRIEIRRTATVFEPERAEWQASISYSADTDPDNDFSAKAAVRRLTNPVPKVGNLRGTADAVGHKLEWDAVATGSPRPEAVSEGFEEGDAWLAEADGWTFIDGDGYPVGGFSDFTVPGITAGQTAASFFVFDASIRPDDPAMRPHSGSRFLAALYRSDNRDTDDWAISPRLAQGEPQRVEFYAKSYSGGYPERIEVLFTRGEADDLGSYERIEGVGGPVAAQWSLFSFTLPADARHFAIHSTAPGGFMLMLDDFSFVADKGYYGELKGYRLYSDTDALTDAPLLDTAFLNTDAEESHVYRVTALYAEGESELSEAVTLQGVSGVAEFSEGTLRIFSRDGAVCVSGSEGAVVTVAAVDGKVLHRGKGDCRVALPKGVYVVSAGSRSAVVRN